MTPAATLLLLAAGGAAQAAGSLLGEVFVSEDRQRLEWHCSDLTLVEGTVPYAVAVEARRSYARTYSAVSQLEQEVLPTLASQRDSATVWRMGMNTLLNVTQLPTTACGELAAQKYDVGAYSMALAVRGGRFAMFYSASANYALVYRDGYERTIKHGGGFLLGHFYSLSAPLWGARVINADAIGGDAFSDGWAFLSSGDGAIGGVSLDYIAGASLDLDYAYVGAGYVGSRGFYLHADQPHTGLFLDTVSELRALGTFEREDLLRYLKTGLSGFAWFLDEGSAIRETLGATDADLSRYRIVSPSGDILIAQDAEDVERAVLPEETLSLTALRQRNLWGILDVAARYQLRPTPQLYEGTIRLHTRDYHPDLLPRRGGRAISDEGGGAAIALGMVNLPERTYFGVTGGPRPYVSAEIIGYLDEDNAYGGNIRAWVRLNDPDTLIVFPYAQGAWEMHLSFTGVF